MLEAFQASSSLESTPTSGEESQEPGSAPKAQQGANRVLPDVAPGFFAVVLCVLVISSFFLGRWSVGTTVQAADDEKGERTPSAEVAFAQPTTDMGEATTASAATEDIEPLADSALQPIVTPDLLSPIERHTQAFMDPANVVTLRVIYYVDDEDGQRRALETALHLEAMGFPAVNPIQKGKYVYVCVGAAPTKNDPDLLRYQRELQLVPGPKPYGKPGDYLSAYTYNIDKLITR